MSRVPELRFSGFTEEWREVRLGEIATFYDSQRIPLKESERKTGPYPYYGASGIIDYIDDYIFNGEYILLGEDGANIVTRNSRLVFLAKGKFWVNNHAHIFQTSESNYFLCETLERINYQKYNTGTAQPKLNAEVVKKIKLFIPSLPEQQKIADFLTAVDEKIETVEAKIDRLERYKKGVMQKLLSGEVRFLGFTEEWREVRLGEIGEFKTSSVDKVIRKNESVVNLINYMDVYRYNKIDNSINISKTSIKKEKLANYLVQKGDVLFTPSSETPDDIGHSAVITEELPNTVYSYHLVRFRPKIKFYIDFLAYVFNNFKILKEFARKSTGTTRFTLSLKSFKDTKARFPTNIEEQQKIADFLTAVDDKITTEKERLERLKAYKKGLLQKMFV